jgi:chromosome segregation ATPase
MSDQPVTRSVLSSVLAATLAKFHEDIIAPDVRRIVQESESRLRNEMQGFHDSILKKLGDLETESAAIKIGLKRVEDRLDKVEARLDEVEQRLEGVENALRRLEERLSRVEKRMDEIAAPQPGLRAEVQRLKTSIETLQARIDALERRTNG